MTDKQGPTGPVGPVTLALQQCERCGEPTHQRLCNNCFIRDEVSRRRQAELSEPPTLRDRFAMAALTGLTRCEFEVAGDTRLLGHEQAAKHAYLYADAMLRARKEEK